jgi:predicted XRE-type DNA-binding protein
MARKEKKYHFIYKTTNILSGKYYIGMHSTDDIEDGYLGSGNRLRLSVRKYGKENFKREILEFCESRVELIKKETEIITLDEISKKECINLKVGGQGGWSEDAKVKFIWLLDNDVDFKKQHSDKMSKVNRDSFIKFNKGEYLNYDWSGKNHTTETKYKMSNTKKGSGIGKTNSQYGTCWINKSGINKKVKKEIIDNYLNEGWTIGRKTEITGEKVKTSKLKEVDVKEIKKLLSVGELSQIKIAKLFGVHQETISKIKRNLIWVNVT